MKIAIIGGGYISQNLQAELTARSIPYEVVVRSALDYTVPSEALFDALRGCTAVVNCSGYTGNPNVDAAETDKENCYLMNVTSPINVYNATRSLHIPYYHISSGCIYSGYDKLWTELDAPNFGCGNTNASWYSKTKHQGERYLENHSCYCIRPRMPFGGPNSGRDYLQKLLNYDQIVDTLNSKTYVPDLCRFIVELVIRTRHVVPDRMDTYNYTQLEPLDVRSIIDIMGRFGRSNPNHKIVGWSDLKLVANRSNCLLSMGKVLSQKYTVRTEQECLIEHLNAGNSTSRR